MTTHNNTLNTTEATRLTHGLRRRNGKRTYAGNRYPALAPHCGRCLSAVVHSMVGAMAAAARTWTLGQMVTLAVVAVLCQVSVTVGIASGEWYKPVLFVVAFLALGFVSVREESLPARVPVTAQGEGR